MHSKYFKGGNDIQWSGGGGRFWDYFEAVRPLIFRPVIVSTQHPVRSGTFFIHGGVNLVTVLANPLPEVQGSLHNGTKEALRPSFFKNTILPSILLAFCS